jgi:hypothetical protein
MEANGGYKYWKLSQLKGCSEMKLEQGKVSFQKRND